MYRLSPSYLASCFARQGLLAINVSISKRFQKTSLRKCHTPLRTRPTYYLTSNPISSPVIGAPTVSATSLDTMVAEDFETILKRKYSGKAHAQRVVDIIGKNEPAISNGVIYLESRMTKLQEDSDAPEPFRQRRFFYYLTGCNLADCHLAYDVASATSILFIPPVDPAEVIWSGLPVGPDEALQMYDVDEVKYTTEVNAELARLAHHNPTSSVFAIAGQVSDNVTFLEFSSKNFDALKPAIESARITKDEYEVACIRKANFISSIAHEAVLQRVKTAVFENELEAAFLERCFTHNAKVMAYDPILAAGRAAATLHYVKNNAPLRGKQNLLIDAGAEWKNYASDITRVFPLSGTFTKESRSIYDIVLRMQLECIQLVKAGAIWDDIHLESHRIAIEGLLSLGILKGKASDIFAARTSTAFFPHGLGHYLGLDTHDVGGKPDYNDPDAFFKYLRLRGRLPAGSVVTVEPGIYFCKYIIEPFVRDPVHKEFIDTTVLDKYWDVGGVRIEDNVLVTEKGNEVLTPAIKKAHDIETLLSN